MDHESGLGAGSARREQAGPRVWTARREQAGPREWPWRMAHVGAKLRLSLSNTLGSRWAWSNIAWAVALDGTARGRGSCGGNSWWWCHLLNIGIFTC